MRILITGGRGLVGSHFQETAQNISGLEILAPTHAEMDITQLSAVQELYQDFQPEATIHFAAFTNVSQSEQERHNQQGECWRINVLGTKILAQVHQLFNGPFIHISTDAVFSGRADSPGPYVESAPVETDPALVTWYGWSKIQSEHLVQELIEHYSIVRISNPVRQSFSVKADYLQKILNGYDNQRLPAFFADQYLTLTFIPELTALLLRLLKQPKTGIFHVSSRNTGTPLAIAEYLLRKARQVNKPLLSGSLTKYLAQTGNDRRYPQYGGLDTQWTQSQFNTQFRTWQEIINEICDQP